MKGIVVKSTGSWYSVRMDSGEVMECRIKGKFRMKGIKTTNPVAVGDVVEVEVNPDGAVINRIEIGKIILSGNRRTCRRKRILSPRMLIRRCWS